MTMCPDPRPFPEGRPNMQKRICGDCLTIAWTVQLPNRIYICSTCLLKRRHRHAPIQHQQAQQLQELQPEPPEDASL